MLTPLLNELSVRLRVETKGPLLIREGRLAGDQRQDFIESEKMLGNVPDGFFVSRNIRDHFQAELDNDKPNFDAFDFYLPGTSLRGAMRNRAEDIMRRLSSKGDNPLCCDPFQENNCGKQLAAILKKRRLTAAEIFNASCAVCRLFGSTAMARRLVVEDGDKQSTLVTDRRQHVAIDRFTGGAVRGALFDDLCVEGIFGVDLRVRNFEIWQLGLLAYILRDMEEGELPLGGGKTKGYGHCTITVETIRLHYWRKTENTLLQGIAQLQPDLVRRFDLKAIGVEGYAIKPEQDRLPHRQTFVLQNEVCSVKDSPFWGAAALAFNGLVNNAGKELLQRFPTMDDLSNLMKGYASAPTEPLEREVIS